MIKVYMRRDQDLNGIENINVMCSESIALIPKYNIWDVGLELVRMSKTVFRPIL